MKRISKIFLCLIAVSIVASMIYVVQAGWVTVSTPAFGNGDRLVFIRNFGCFGEDRAGERYFTQSVEIPGVQEVISADVFMTGFNTWYTREGHDHELMGLRMDVWVEGQPYWQTEEFPQPGEQAKKWYVPVKLTYASYDENIGDDDDFNTACIGYVVVAQVR